MNASNNHSPGVKLEVRGLSKSFEGKPAVRDVSFVVQPGEVFVIMGPSGSGKSVLLKVIAGLLGLGFDEIARRAERARRRLILTDVPPFR